MNQHKPSQAHRIAAILDLYKQFRPLYGDQIEEADKLIQQGLQDLVDGIIRPALKPRQ